MATITDQKAALLTHPFDAPAWLTAWSDNGGIVALAGDRLFIGRLRPIDRKAGQQLDQLRGAIHQRQAAGALAAYLAARSHGEVR